MADKTESKQEMNREELAAYFRQLADEFDREGELSVSVGNKSVLLDPSESIRTEIEVVERSSILRGNRESMEIEMSWKTK